MMMPIPDRKCDLVMKGGVTSGIVYPSAIVELAQEYQFVNIGGASAGAIAAAVTAAAEYQRQSSGSAAGFERVAALPEWFGKSANDKPNLFRLFRPAEGGEKFMDAFAAEEKVQGWPKKAWAVFKVLKLGELGGAVAGLGLLWVLAMAAVVAALRQQIVPAIIALIALVAGALLFLGATLLATAAGWLREILGILARNRFGLCTGMGGPEALTEWLSREIQITAGLAVGERPLTFRDLWECKGGSEEQPTINLQMMTTNLTFGLPERLPFKARTWFFAEEEFRDLFPPDIVSWLIAKSGDAPQIVEGLTLRPLPSAGDIPLVVVARMSLSFPLLLSAIPLHSIDFGSRENRDKKQDRLPERCWFSDGGITSNLPVHFFDAPIPSWPTFAIDLGSHTPRYQDDGESVYLPSNNRGAITVPWSFFDVSSSAPGERIVKFLVAIVGTMHNWQHEIQLRMPGYRDRIATIYLTSKQGGLNLAMDADTTNVLTQFGKTAGDLLRDHFTAGQPPPKVQTTWPNHEWTRFLASMTALETYLLDLESDLTKTPDYTNFIKGVASLPSYAATAEERRGIEHAIDTLLPAIREALGRRPFGNLTSRPHPEGELRLVPRV